MYDRFMRRTYLLIRRDLLARRHPNVTRDAAVRNFQIWVDDLTQAYIDRSFGGLGAVLNSVPFLHEVLGDGSGCQEKEYPYA
jgi:hypothetical protein